MARLFFRLLILFLAFTVEVQIHASPLTWLAEPAHCTFNEKGCAFQARIEKAELSWEEAKVSAVRGAVIGWSDSQELQIVRGTVLVTLTEGKRIKLPTANISGPGDFLVERKGSATMITCLSGEALIKPVGSNEVLGLPAGYTQLVDVVDGLGHVQTEIPLTAPLLASIKKWWSLFPGTKAEFLPRAKQFMKTVAANVEATSRWHLDLVQREIAAQAESDRLEIERQKKVAEERKRYRDLFRKLNYLGDSLPD